MCRFNLRIAVQGYSIIRLKSRSETGLMKDKSLIKHLVFLTERFPQLSTVKASIMEAYQIMEDAYTEDRKLLIAGNGGSAADSEHIAGELMKRFKNPRPISRELKDKLIAVDETMGRKLADHLESSLMAIPLVAHEALSTAYINDVDGEGVFAQQLLGYGRKGDVFLAISTSGNSRNILNAAVVARAIGIKVIGLTGLDGGRLEQYANCVIKAPEKETYMIQELHLPIYHTLCMMLEEHFFCNTNKMNKSKKKVI